MMRKKTLIIDLALSFLSVPKEEGFNSKQEELHCRTASPEGMKVTPRKMRIHYLTERGIVFSCHKNKSIGPSVQEIKYAIATEYRV
jgi:hypothetical protein